MMLLLSNSYYLRLNDEALDLQQRIANLNAFVSGLGFLALDASQQTVLLQRIHDMELGLAVLNRRIDLLEG
ncbi:MULTISPECIES: hypothetical protein [Vibrio]|uniref:crAss001_48 related protein n=1 Tax=Vibrio TaxID=662 RepID=UPI0004DF032B|nr:hypothetical protein [Vibrio parahaemolyticus]MDF4609820.1 hypothetical protein [Vibrio parahaemolyticus]